MGWGSAIPGQSAFAFAPPHQMASQQQATSSMIYRPKPQLMQSASPISSGTFLDHQYPVDGMPPGYQPSTAIQSSAFRSEAFTSQP